MGKIYTSAEQLIGGTPLLELTHLERELGLSARILGKLESFNPGGSAKDRIAKSMLDDGEARGILKSGSVIIEPTSATPASVWHWWPPPGVTGPSSSCRTP